MALEVAQNLYWSRRQRGLHFAPLTSSSRVVSNDRLQNQVRAFISLYGSDSEEFRFHSPELTLTTYCELICAVHRINNTLIKPSTCHHCYIYRKSLWVSFDNMGNRNQHSVCTKPPNGKYSSSCSLLHPDGGKLSVTRYVTLWAKGDQWVQFISTYFLVANLGGWGLQGWTTR